MILEIHQVLSETFFVHIIGNENYINNYSLLPSDPVENGVYFLSEYVYSDNTLVSTVQHDGWAEMATKVISTIRLMGAKGVTEILVNDVAHTDFETLASGEVAISNLNIRANSEFRINFITN